MADRKRNGLLSTLQWDRSPIILMAIIFTVCVCLVGVFSSEGTGHEGIKFTEDGVQYQVISEYDRTVMIVHYKGSASDLNIPASVTFDDVDYSVEIISGSAFKGSTTLTSVTIPDSVWLIGNNAFQGCTGLTSISISENVSSIGVQAFAQCTSMTDFVVSEHNESYRSIDGVLFSRDGTKLMQYPCGKGGDYNVPNTAISIDDYAFFSCVRLTSISMHKDVSDIGSHAFEMCSSLNDFIVNTENPSYSSVSGVLFNKDGSVLIQYPVGRAGTYTVPEEVITIGKNAFKGCTGLTSVIIGNDVTTIKGSAFKGCTGLTSITFGIGVTAIKESAFKGCTALASLTIPDCVNEIGEGAFSGCTHLTSVIIGNGIGVIVDNTFEHCDRLNSVYLGNNVEIIEKRAFMGCTNLSKFTVSTHNRFFADIDGVLLNYTGDTLIQYPYGKAGAYTIPDGVISISSEAFLSCTRLTSVIIEGAVRDIGTDAFRGCIGLTTVIMGSNVIDIGNGAFQMCNRLTSIVVGDGTKNIGDNAFRNCPSLNSIILGQYVEKIGNGAFHGCIGLERISIPGSVNEMGGNVFQGCVGLTAVLFNDGVTCIGDYAFDGCISLTHINTPDSVRSIGAHAFSRCSELVSVEIGIGVEEIGPKAFESCPSLTTISVDYENQHYRVVDGVLYNKGLTTLIKCPDGIGGAITIPKETSSIDSDDSFAGSVKLTSIGVESGNATFSSVNGVLYNIEGTSLIKCPGGMDGTFTVPSDVVSIGNFAFYGCIKLTAIEVDTSNPYYSSESGVLFSKDGSKLIKYPGGKVGAYTIPEKVTDVMQNAFSYCYGLTALNVRWSYAFDINILMCPMCPNLTEINVTGDPYIRSIDGVLYTESFNELYLTRCPEGTTSLVLPESIGGFSPESAIRCHLLKEIVVTGGSSLYIYNNALMGVNPELTFKSGKDGFDLRVFIDEAKTIEATGAMLSSGWAGTLYFDWIEVPDDPPTPDPPTPDPPSPTDGTSDGVNTGLVVGGIAGAIALSCAGVFLFMRRRP